MEFHLETKTTPLTPKANVIKHHWDADLRDLQFHVQMLTQLCPLWLNRTLASGKMTPPQTVSLLQRSPSSPVRCHASGFYPPSIQLIWRKDGEHIREIHGEILPNDDETFQLHVDLDISSLRYEDWPRYDCLFQFSGAEEKIVLSLDKTAIHTNWKGMSPGRGRTVVVSLLILLIIAAFGFISYKKITTLEKKGTKSIWRRQADLSLIVVSLCVACNSQNRPNRTTSECPLVSAAGLLSWCRQDQELPEECAFQ
nr:major histocompatibility complex class I-related gene protein-like isoform X2 [Nothobranchius furzeri]